MRLHSLRRSMPVLRMLSLLHHLGSALVAFLTALCLMAAGTAQASAPAAHSSVTPGKVKSEV
jgi:hypothetical protein